MGEILLCAVPEGVFQDWFNKSITLFLLNALICFK
jgi:hypothetical protein